MNQAPAQRYLEQNAEGTFTKSIRHTVLENTPIIVPTLTKQCAIIAMAHTLNEEQRQVQKLMDNGERMVVAITSDLYHMHGHSTIHTKHS